MDKYVFCDASFSKEKETGICGYRNNDRIYYEILDATNSTNCENYAFELAKKNFNKENFIFCVDCLDTYAIGLQEGYQMLKLRGHMRNVDKTELDLHFSCLDKVLRKVLRQVIKNR